MNTITKPTNLPAPVRYKTGTMTKDPREMTDTERTVWQQQCADNARTYLFSIGQPLVYRRTDGQMVAEYENGRIVEVKTERGP